MYFEELRGCTLHVSPQFRYPLHCAAHVGIVSTSWKFDPLPELFTLEVVLAFVELLDASGVHAPGAVIRCSVAQWSQAPGQEMEMEMESHGGLKVTIRQTE